MRIPLNAIHWYIGWPILLIISMRALIAQSRTPSHINKYFGLSAGTFCLAFTAYGLPPLVTVSPAALTIFTIIGDGLQFLALYFMWLVVARMYFPGTKQMRLLIGSLALILTGAAVFLSLETNLANPVTLSLINGAWQINYEIPLAYQVVAAIQYTALILVAMKFWQQSHTTKSVATIRLRTIAVVFYTIGVFYLLRPFLNITSSSSLQTVLMTWSLGVGGAFVLATLYLGRNPKEKR